MHEYWSCSSLAGSALQGIHPVRDQLQREQVHLGSLDVAASVAGVQHPRGKAPPALPVGPTGVGRGGWAPYPTPLPYPEDRRQTNKGEASWSRLTLICQPSFLGVG